ncbi:MAG: hypothetical protein ABR555_06180 [Pyrinomonadaceae bacterium]
MVKSIGKGITHNRNASVYKVGASALALTIPVWHVAYHGFG